MNKTAFKLRILSPSILPVMTVILAIMIAGFILTGCAGAAAEVAPPPAVSQLITPLEYQDAFRDPSSHLLIDVRTPEEFDAGHIPGAVNIPVEELGERLNEVPGETPIVVYCRSGNRSATAAGILARAGYSPVFDLGGIQNWVAQGFPVQ
jgi:phage shock protein E